MFQIKGFLIWQRGIKRSQIIVEFSTRLIIIKIVKCRSLVPSNERKNIFFLAEMNFVDRF
jgi:hypothetical protein